MESGFRIRSPVRYGNPPRSPITAFYAISESRRSMKNRIQSAALIFPATLILASAAFTGCLFDNASDAEPKALGLAVTSTPYSVVGNRIITPGYDDSVKYCFLGSMIDTVFHIQPDTVGFEISGNTLLILEAEDRTETNAAIQWVTTYARAGSGTGLEGDWNGTGRHYRVVSGTLTAQEKSKMDLWDSTQQAYTAGRSFTTRFAQGKLTTFVDEDYPKAFVAEWNIGFGNGPGMEADSARYDIRLKAIDKNAIDLIGKKNGETVRITENADGRTYTSTKAGHSEHRYASHPTSCPNDYQPVWFAQFLEDNLKVPQVFEKSAENGLKRGFPIRIPFIPLKTIHSLLN
jgi:hypothetical protein